MGLWKVLQNNFLQALFFMKNNPLRFFYWLDDTLYKVEAVLLILTTLLVIVFGFLPIVLRGIFDRSIIWAPELNRLLVLWLTFFGASLAIRDNKHISIEVLTQFLPKKFAPFTKILVYSFVIYICARFTYIGYYYFEFEKFNINLGDMLFGPVAKTYFKIIYPLGFGAFTYHYCIKLMTVVRDLQQQNQLTKN